MSRALTFATLLLSASLLLMPWASAAATDIVDARWQGENLAIRFSDSLPYRIDLAESDTNQLVLRLSSLHLPSTLATELQGPAGRSALLIQSAPNELRITVRSSDRMGYGTIWRPYSHTLVIHTFRWRQLGYAEEQYFKGLLAFEQQLEAQGIEYLRLAYAAGDRRAASALGAHYARRGDNALAAQYLSSPTDADDFAALAQDKRSMGDSAAARELERSFVQLTAPSAPASNRSDDKTPPAGSPSRSPSQRDWFASENLPALAAIGAGILVLVITVIVLTRRPRKSDISTVESPPVSVTPVEPPAVIPSPQETTAPPESSIALMEVAENQESIDFGAEKPDDAPEQETSEQEEVTTEAPSPPDDTPRPHDRRALLSAQAAELRRRIETVRAQSEEAGTEEPSSADPSILSEARRLRLSRDSVELRKRLEKVR